MAGADRQEWTDRQLDAVLARAAELTAAGAPSGAIALLRPVLAARPEHAGTWCRLSAALLDAGQPDESLDAAKRAMVLGERSWAHRLASLALLELGRPDEAVVSAREAVRREPSDWRCQVTLAEALCSIAPGEALPAARRAVELAPRQPRTHEVLGDVARQVSEDDLAARAYQDALRLEPGNDAVAEKLATLARPGSARRNGAQRETAPRTAARGRGRPPAPARFGRAQRAALWLLLRRTSVWLAVSTFVLLIAGMPRPSPLLAWFGLGAVVFVLGVWCVGWLGLPHGARLGSRALASAAAPMAVAAVLLAIALLLLVAWTVGLALGARGMQLLTPVLGCALIAAVISSFGLWRLLGRGR